jgi:hypothetical protein
MTGLLGAGVWLYLNMTETTLATALRPADRCDRCGARAYIRATLANGELLFCAHHGREYMPKLAAQALTVDDQTDRLAQLGAD